MIDELQNISNLVELALAGQMTVTKPNQLMLYPIQLIENAQHSVYATVVWEQRNTQETELDKKYIEKQIVTKNDKLFILPNRTIIEPDNDLLVRMYQEMQIGVNVTYLTENQWKIDNMGTDYPEEFGIFDEQHVWVYQPLINQQTMRHAILYNNPAMVKKYLDLFHANQLAAQPLSPEQLAKAEKLVNG
jgi:hypothetical protein